MKATEGEDEDTLEEKKIEKMFAGRSRDHEHMISRVHTYTKKRPIYGILAEPLRGNLSKEQEGVITHLKEYIPAAHVDFLE